MKQLTIQPRYIARPMLASVIDEQGRRRIWMGEQVNMSRSLVSHVIAGRRTVSKHDAEVWASILGVPFSALWKLAERSKTLRIQESDERNAA